MVTRVMEVKAPPFYPPLNPPFHFIIKRSPDYTDNYTNKKAFLIKILYIIDYNIIFFNDLNKLIYFNYIN